MFEPVSENILRWKTPDPEGDWMMCGHLIFENGRCILIDPPLVPRLIDSISRLGKVEAVILTTMDHIRGAKYISEKTGADLFIPDQAKSFWLDPEEVLSQKGIRGFQKYGGEDLFGLKCYHITVPQEGGTDEPYLDEFALLTDKKELIVGDIAIGKPDGGVVLAPEWFPHDPPYKENPYSKRAFKRVLDASDADSLLAPHGCNIYGGLQKFI